MLFFRFLFGNIRTVTGQVSPGFRDKGVGRELDTVYLSSDETIGEGAEYDKNMIPGCACFSWFQKTYMMSDGDGYFDASFTGA